MYVIMYTGRLNYVQRDFNDAVFTSFFSLVFLLIET